MTINLGIALDYPVNWDFEMILRDLIQNYYDEVDYHQFGKEFRYSYTEENSTYTLEMELRDHPFSYEWLVYIGGSTKTGTTKIGKYGEGFKICMLSLLKLGITDITMHSADWELVPCICGESIDDENIPMLGYNVNKTKDDGITLLRIRSIPLSYKRLLDEALLHFFYPENPLFGELITENEDISIYTAGEMKIPCRQNLGIKGIVYAYGLARGRLPIPLFILEKDDKARDTRRRELYDWFDVWEEVYDIATKLDPDASFRILEIMRAYWNDRPQKVYDCRTWYYFVCQLVRNVAKSEDKKALFMAKYPNLFYIDREGKDRKRNTLIRQTKVWAEERTGLVNPSFRLLGAKSLVEIFKKEKMASFRVSDDRQREMVGLLEMISNILIPDYLKEETPPPVLIGEKGQSSMDPLRFAVKGENKKYHLEKIIMEEDDFLPGSFEKSLVGYCDKRLQVSGSRKSNRMNVLFTRLGTSLIMCLPLIPGWRAEWERLAAK